jgi:netrin-G3 ligand
VPYEYARGIILGYKILVLGYHLAYKNVSNDTSWNVTIDGENTLEHVFTSFEMYTDYVFQILAFTVKGDGNISEPLTVRTDEDCE